MEPRFTVSQFNELINSTLNEIGDVVIEGEVTQFNISPKGGVNIVIKDTNQEGVLNLSGYAPRVEGVSLIKEGMKVEAFGVPSLWSLSGRFSLQIYKILPLGKGALKEAYEQLKKQLASEGLFSIERKRSLPTFVQKIALLTGKNSAAQSDFLKILQEYNSGIEVDFYPVQVQGKYSEIEIISTLKYVNELDYDCVVLTRGGGSLEDLITFNSEPLARLIFSLKIPVVVGVGHERDESIADFVADIRSSTPSQAAYYLVNHNENFIDEQNDKIGIMKEKIDDVLLNFNFALERKISSITTYISILVNRYVNMLDAKTSFMYERIYSNINTIKFKLMNIRNVLALFPNQIKEIKFKLMGSESKISFFPRVIKDYINHVNALERIINSYDVKKIVKRGFAILRNDSGHVISSINDVEVNSMLNIHVSDGNLKSKIIHKNKLN